MLNKKGSTLLELVISIMLISLVLVFLMRLIVDLNNTETNNTFANDNQIVRSEILRVLERELSVSSLISLNDEGSSEDKLVINFTFKDGSSKIEAEKDKFSYTNKEGKLRTWSIKNGSIYPSQANVLLSYNTNSYNDKVYTLEIDIEVHTTNDLNNVNSNNVLDDISLSYIGKFASISGDVSCLGYSCSGDKTLSIVLPDTSDDIPDGPSVIPDGSGSSGGGYNPSLDTTLVEYVKSKFTGTQGENGIYYHNSSLANGAGDDSYRYAGENSNNFVCFGTEANVCPDDNLYRIIGVFNGQVKLIKWDYANSSLLGTGGDYVRSNSQNNSYPDYKGSLSKIDLYYWNKSNLFLSLILTGTYNDWSYSRLASENLNKTYISNIGSNWANKIATTTWKIGGNTNDKIINVGANQAYQNEIVNPSTGTYSSKIGLMYVSDYAYAASKDTWTTSLNSSNIKEKNWMYMGVEEWTITRTTSNTSDIFQISNDASNAVSSASYNASKAVRPVFYLNSDVRINEYHVGSKTDPLRLS